MRPGSSRRRQRVGGPVPMMRLSASTKTTLRLAGAGLRLLHLAVGDEDHQVAGVHQPGRGTVDADDPVPRGPLMT